MSQDTRHRCDPYQRRALYDARLIFCCFVCEKCEAARRAEFRAEIFSDPDYETTEDIEGEFFS